MAIYKRFPATTNDKEKNFLNDKKISGELYGLFQTLSVPEGNRTIVHKQLMPSRQEGAEKIGVKDVKTYSSYLKYLIENGYIIENKKGRYYELPNVESMYILLDLDTVKYILENLPKYSLKVYIYLGQRYKLNKRWNFSQNQIGDNIGLNVRHNEAMRRYVREALEALQKNGLLEYEKLENGNSYFSVLTKWNPKIEREF